MTDESRRDDFIRGWIDSEAPRRAPERLVDAVRAELSVTPQDQAWARGLGRSYLSRVAVYAAAIVVIFVVGFVAAGLLFNGSIVGTPPTPSPTPTPSSTFRQACSRAGR